MANGYYMYRDWNFPIPEPMRVYGYGVADLVTAERMSYDTLRFNPMQMRYETESQTNKIRDLESKLEQKERKRQNDLQSIIGYFYKR